VNQPVTSVGRLAGALLVQTQEAGADAWFVLGDTKRPCDWRASGFETPLDRDPRQTPWQRLSVNSTPALTGAQLRLSHSGLDVVRSLSSRLLVSRTGAVSERLWRLIFDVSDEDDVAQDAVITADWLVEIPAPAWEIVRDAVLKCT
jgi:hypothetical protein